MAHAVLTLHVRVEESKDGQSYPLRLFLDDGEPGWEANAIAVGTIPLDLAVPNPPPHPDDPGQGLTVASAMAWFQAKTDPSPNGFEAIGDLLYKLLDQPGVSPAWTKLRGEAWTHMQKSGESIRTVLAIQPARLRALPWELLYHEERVFFNEPHGPCYRDALAAILDLPKLPRPLKLLVVVGCEAGDAKVQWEEEVQAICDVTWPRRTQFDVELLLRPSAERLNHELENFAPHILHFVGHGTEARGTEKASLDFHDEEAGTNWSWTSRDIFQRLQTRAPQLAFINACRSSAFAGASGGWMIADALVAAGVPAVIGMQGDIQGNAASHFAARVYEQLADGQPIDRAVAKARLDTSQAAFVKDRRDWALPTLTLAAPPAAVLALEPPPRDDISKLAQTSASLQRLVNFVGRRRERRAVRTSATAKQNLLVLSGGQAIGKSEFIKTCLEYFALRGARVVYVDLATGAKHDAIGLLRLIRGPKAVPAKDLLRPELYAHFADFNEGLNALLEGNPVPNQLLHTEESGTDDERPYSADRAKTDIHRQVFQSFAKALVTSANSEPLFIVIDHVGGPNGGITPIEFIKYVRPLFVDEVARGDVGPVRLVLAVRDEHADELGLTDLLAGSFGQILKPFPLKDWRWVASEYLLARKIDRRKAKGPMAELGANLTAEGFTPDDLEALGDYVSRFKGKGP